jgi:hypothetical protein
MMTTKEHDRAVQGLDAGLVEQDRLTESYHGAVGTSSEVGAYARLRAAGADVAAREVWLHWIDDERYRGLNAGPFELLAESSGPSALHLRPQGGSGPSRPRAKTAHRS